MRPSRALFLFGGTLAYDEMHVLIYKTLAYLYDCMKKGEKPENIMLSCDGFIFGGIPERYWTLIWIQMLDKGLVKGVGSIAYNGEPHVVLHDHEVTLEGIGFMQENKMMRKALKLLQDAKCALPFI